MTWVIVDPTTGKQKCPRHDPEGVKLFGPRARCLACDTDPPAVVVDADAELATPPSAPDGCLTSVQHEQKLTALASFLDETSRKLCAGKGRIKYTTVFKGIELAIKAYNAANAFTQTRERRAHVARLERRRREMHTRVARGGSN